MLKNYVGSFSSNVEDNIDRTCKKVGLIFASNFDRCKINLLVYVKLWKQACLPSIMFGAELWTLTPTLLLKLERCQYWFLKHIFYRVSHKEGINKKLLFGAAQGLNLQFLNLFGFSISVSFVWCII